MSKQNKVSSKNKKDVSVWMLFAAVFFVIMFFSWYFLIFVKNNEQALTQKSFRVLTQIAKNFEDRENSFRIIFENKKEFRDSLLIERADSGPAEKPVKYLSGLELEATDSLSKDYFYFSRDYKLLKYYADYGNRFKRFSKSDTLFFKINKNDFFKPLERKDVFEGLLILKKNSPNNKSGKMVYSTIEGDIELNNLDSLADASKHLSSGVIKEVELSGVDYVLFLRPVKLKNNEAYYIGGVIGKDKYVQQARSINPFVAILLLIIFFIFLFSIPLIKLKLISKNSMLKISDLLFSAGSIIFITFFTFLIVLSLQNHLQRKADEKILLKSLSDSVSLKFTREVSRISSTLDLFIEGKDIFKKEFVVESIDIFNSASSIERKQIKLNKNAYPFFKYLYKMNSDGDQDTIISSRKGTPVKSNYSFRKYFKESGEWRLNEMKLMIEAIVSNTSGEKLGVISKRHSDDVYAATSRLTSVINTILPPGYGFSIINSDGEVKFHSNSDRMLQENFIAETENSEQLLQAIYGNQKSYFRVKYLGTFHSCYIQPLSTLPLYIVTFHDDTIANSVKLQITFLTFIFTFAVLLLFLMLVIGSRLVTLKKSRLNRSFDIAAWLRPDKTLINKYRKVTAANFTAIIILIISYFFSSAVNTIFLLFLFVITQLVFTYTLTQYNSWRHFRKNHLAGALFPSSIFIFSLFYYANKAKADFDVLIIADLLLIAINIILVISPKNIFSKWYEVRTFYLYLYTWVLFILVLPTLIFFTIFFNFEVKSELTYNLFNYGINSGERNYSFDEFYKKNIREELTPYKNERKNKGIYFLKYLEPSNSNEFNTASEQVNTGLDNILHFMELNLDSYGSERKSLIKLGMDDAGKAVIKRMGNTTYLKYSPERIHYSDSSFKSSLYFKGTSSKFGFNNYVSFISFAFIFLAILFLLFKIIKFTSARMFGTSIELSAINEKFSDVLKQRFNSGYNLMVQFPSRHEVTKLSSIEAKELNYDDLDPAAADPFKDCKEKNIINNIHINIENPQADIKKFEQIIKCIEFRRIQFVLVFDCSFKSIIDRTDAKIELEENSEKLSLLKELRSLLQSVKHIFVHLYAPISDNENLKLNIPSDARAPQLYKLIYDELNVSNYLRDHQFKAISDFVSKLEKTQTKNPVEKIILEIEEMAHGYYESIWSACSDKEKIFLYDLADDLVLNDKNKEVIKVLLYKGLITNNRYFDLMNRSFRNYIITKFESDETRRVLKKYYGKGQWSNYRAPIILLILALAFFIAFQENILSNLTSIITSIIAIIGLVTKLSGLLPTGLGGNSGGGGK
ncbi:MAG: cache domain-containing protein [Ignavibacteriae bacterium]|nr:hypothetical protein [Ignavibacteriota bacterium]NOH00276.1 cache domain-containing protein [Ignavibacteriota bacterium]